MFVVSLDASAVELLLSCDIFRWIWKCWRLSECVSGFGLLYFAERKLAKRRELTKLKVIEAIVLQRKKQSKVMRGR